MKADLLILDDWGPDRLTAGQRRDLMEIVEDRRGRRSILITSQLPVTAWHAVIDEPTFADVRRANDPPDHSLILLTLDRVRAFLRTSGSHALTPQRPPPGTRWPFDEKVGQPLRKS